MADEMPAKVQQKRATMDEPSNDRRFDLTCHCGAKSWYLGIKYHSVTYAAVIGVDEDGEAKLGDITTRAPYSYWMCANGHVKTDGY